MLKLESGKDLKVEPFEAFDEISKWNIITKTIQMGDVFRNSIIEGIKQKRVVINSYESVIKNIIDKKTVLKIPLILHYFRLPFYTKLHNKLLKFFYLFSYSIPVKSSSRMLQMKCLTHFTLRGSLR